jgi:hypothetical protein
MFNELLNIIRLIYDKDGQSEVELPMNLTTESIYSFISD